MRYPLVLPVLLVLALAPIAADAKLARTGAPEVTFSAVGPAGMKIHGTTNQLEVLDDGTNVTVRVPLSGLKTGISLRDTHMREKYLQVGQYPNADLQVARAALKLPAGSATGAGDAQGTLSMHGKSKVVAFHYQAKHDGSVFHVTGTVRVNMKDFAIDVPSYAGVTVKPDVDVDVTFDASGT